MAGRVRYRESFSIWPGFVDALTTLLIMMLFVLTVFVASQFFLSDTLAGRDRRITELTQREADLSGQIAAERQRIAQAERDISSLHSELATMTARRELLDREKAALEQQRSQLGQRVDALLREKAALEQQRQSLARRVETLEKEKASGEAQRADLEKRLGDLDREKLLLLARIVGLEKDRADRDARIGGLETDKSRAADDKAKLTLDVANLEARLRALEAQRHAEEQAKRQLAADKTTLEQRLTALEAQRRGEEDAKKNLATQKLTLEQRIATLERDLDAMRRERDRLQASLTAGEKAVGDQKRLTDEQAAELALLNRQLAALRQQLSQIEAALRVSETKTDQQKVEIEELGRRLNVALATQVQELQRYRSEFFGKLREILGDRADIRIVGDRFVFQSEVLFPAGSDEINPAGREQMAKLARTLIEISAKIPTELNWVLRVDGHTDRRPIVSARFPSNWELSTARAIAVVRFLVAQGVPPTRLVAAGFGEHQPLEAGEGEDAYGKNRRIELKLTER